MMRTNGIGLLSKIYFSLFFCCFFLSSTTIAQDQFLDSLKTVVGGDLPDSVKVDALNLLSRSYLSNDLMVALDYAEEAKVLARQAGYKSGLAYGHKWAGVVYYYRSEWLEALDEWKTSGQIFDTIDDAVGESNILSNVGAIYFNQGALDKAIENYTRSLKLAEQVGDKLRIATAFLNIGAVYLEKPETYDLALQNFTEALSLAKEFEDGEDKERAIGTATLNIGEIYFKLGDYDQAVGYYDQSLNAFRGRDGEPSALIYMSEVQAQLGDYKKAQALQTEAYELAILRDDRLAAVQALKVMAETQKIVGNTASAITHYKMAIPYAQDLPDAMKDLVEIYHGLSFNYSDQNQFDSAYKYQTLFINLSDTLDQSNKRLDILQRDYELDRKKKEISLLNLEKEFQDEVIARQRIIQLLVILGLVSVAIFLYIALRQKKRITKEKNRSDELLLNILPYEVAEELKDTGVSSAKNVGEVTVMFTDFKDFVKLSKEYSAKELVEELNLYFKAFDEIVSEYKVEKIKTIGDSYMAASGVPIAQKDSAANAVHAAFAMKKVVIERQKMKNPNSANHFSMRIGLHTGPVVAGIVGLKKFQYDIWGDTVNTASRMERHGTISEINISQSTYDRIKDYEEFEFEKREKVEVKGKGEMQMYFVRLKNS